MAITKRDFDAMMKGIYRNGVSNEPNRLSVNSVTNLAPSNAPRQQSIADVYRQNVLSQGTAQPARVNVAPVVQNYNDVQDNLAYRQRVNDYMQNYRYPQFDTPTIDDSWVPQEANYTPPSFDINNRIEQGKMDVSNSLLQGGNMSDDEIRMLENQGYYGGADRAIMPFAIAGANTIGNTLINADVTYKNMTGEAGKQYDKLLQDTYYNPTMTGGRTGAEAYKRFKTESAKTKIDSIDTSKLGYKMADWAGRETEKLMDGMTGTEQFLTASFISMLQNLELMPLAMIPGIGQELTVLAMSSSAAGGTMYDQLKQGKSLNDAWTRGIIDGAIEGATEKIGVDNWIKTFAGNGGNVIKSLLVQAGSEGGEEALSYLMGFLYDAARKDPNAKFSAQELLTNVMSGALSGLMLGAIGVGGGAMNANSMSDYFANAYTNELARQRARDNREAMDWDVRRADIRSRLGNESNIPMTADWSQAMAPDAVYNNLSPERQDRTINAEMYRDGLNILRENGGSARDMAAIQDYLDTLSLEEQSAVNDMTRGWRPQPRPQTQTQQAPVRTASTEVQRSTPTEETARVAPTRIRGNADSRSFDHMSENGKLKLNKDDEVVFDRGDAQRNAVIHALEGLKTPKTSRKAFIDNDGDLIYVERGKSGGYNVYDMDGNRLNENVPFSEQDRSKYTKINGAVYNELKESAANVTKGSNSRANQQTASTTQARTQVQPQAQPQAQPRRTNEQASDLDSIRAYNQRLFEERRARQQAQATEQPVAEATVAEETAPAEEPSKRTTEQVTRAYETEVKEKAKSKTNANYESEKTFEKSLKNEAERLAKSNDSIEKAYVKDGHIFVRRSNAKTYAEYDANGNVVREKAGSRAPDKFDYKVDEAHLREMLGNASETQSSTKTAPSQQSKQETVQTQKKTLEPTKEKTDDKYRFFGGTQTGVDPNNAQAKKDIQEISSQPQFRNVINKVLNNNAGASETGEYFYSYTDGKLSQIYVEVKDAKGFTHVIRFHNNKGTWIGENLSAGASAGWSQLPGDRNLKKNIYRLRSGRVEQGPDSARSIKAREKQEKAEKRSARKEKERTQNALSTKAKTEVSQKLSAVDNEKLGIGVENKEKIKKALSDLDGMLHGTVYTRDKIREAAKKKNLSVESYISGQSSTRTQQEYRDLIKYEEWENLGNVGMSKDGRYAFALVRPKDGPPKLFEIIKNGEYMIRPRMVEDGNIADDDLQRALKVGLVGYDLVDGEVVATNDEEASEYKPKTEKAQLPPQSETDEAVAETPAPQVESPARENVTSDAETTPVEGKSAERPNEQPAKKKLVVTLSDEAKARVEEARKKIAENRAKKAETQQAQEQTTVEAPAAELTSSTTESKATYDSVAISELANSFAGTVIDKHPDQSIIGGAVDTRGNAWIRTENSKGVSYMYPVNGNKVADKPMRYDTWQSKNIGANKGPEDIKHFSKYGVGMVEKDPRPQRTIADANKNAQNVKKELKKTKNNSSNAEVASKPSLKKSSDNTIYAKISQNEDMLNNRVIKKDPNGIIAYVEYTNKKGKTSFYDVNEDTGEITNTRPPSDFDFSLDELGERYVGTVGEYFGRTLEERPRRARGEKQTVVQNRPTNVVKDASSEVSATDNVKERKIEEAKTRIGARKINRVERLAKRAGWSIYYDYNDSANAKNGFATDDGIVINLAGQDNIYGVFFHEALHKLRNSKKWGRFSKSLHSLINSSPKLRQSAREWRDAYVNNPDPKVIETISSDGKIDEAKVEEEVLCKVLEEIAGDSNAFSSEDVISRLLGERSFVESVRDLAHNIRISILSTFGQEGRKQAKRYLDVEKSLQGILDSAKVDEKTIEARKKAPRTLMRSHALSYKRLIWSLQNGGIANGSMRVASRDASTAGNYSYGDALVLFNKQAVERALSEGIAGDGDIYSVVMGDLFKSSPNRDADGKWQAYTEVAIDPAYAKKAVDNINTLATKTFKGKLKTLSNKASAKDFAYGIDKLVGDNRLVNEDADGAPFYKLEDAKEFLMDNTLVQLAFMADNGDSLSNETLDKVTGRDPNRDSDVSIAAAEYARKHDEEFDEFVDSFLSRIGAEEIKFSKDGREVSTAQEVSMIMSEMNMRGYDLMYNDTMSDEELLDEMLGNFETFAGQRYHSVDEMHGAENKLTYDPDYPFDQADLDDIYEAMVEDTASSDIDKLNATRELLIGISVSEKKSDFAKWFKNDSAYGIALGDKADSYVDDIWDIVEQVRNGQYQMFERKPSGFMDVYSDINAIFIPSYYTQRQINELSSLIDGTDTQLILYNAKESDNLNVKTLRREKAINDFLAEEDALAGEGKIDPERATAFSVKNKRVQNDTLQDLGEKHGFHVERPNVRNESIPLKDGSGKNITRAIQTVINSNLADDTMVARLEERIANGDFSYSVNTDNAAIQKAKDYIDDRGFKFSCEEFINKSRNGERIGKDDMVRAGIMIEAAIENGQYDLADTLSTYYAFEMNDAGQKLQAGNAVKRLGTGFGSMLYKQESINRIQKQIDKYYGKKAIQIRDVIDQEIIDAYMNARSEEEMESTRDALYNAIADKLPINLLERINAYRYLSMLGNIKTQGRNVSANLLQKPAQVRTQMTRGIIEAALQRAGLNIERTTTVRRATAEQRDYAKRDAQLMQETLLGEGKYTEYAKDSLADIKRRQNPLEYKEHWADKHGAQYFILHAIDKMAKGSSKVLSAWNNVTTWAMDKGDLIFAMPAYETAFAKYMAANNWTSRDMTPARLEKARAEATRQALEATFRERNELAEAIGSAERKLRASGTIGGKIRTWILEGVLPFRRTPMNIAKRAIEYTPAGRMIELAQQLANVSKDGRFETGQFLDGMSKSLTGTSIMMIGMWLAKLGLLRALGAGDEKDRKMQKQRGYQDYSLNVRIPGTDDYLSYGMEWAGSSFVPLFVGARLYESMSESGDINLSNIATVLGDASSPVFETTMFSGLNDTLKNLSYGSNPITAFMQNSLSSLANQFVPTIVGQTAKIIDPVSRTTYTAGKQGFDKVVSRTLQKMGNKIPGQSQKNIPYYNVWGEAQSNGGYSLASRIIYNMFSPGYYSKVSKDPVELEIARLYDATGEGGVVPTNYKTYMSVDSERIDFTPGQYQKYTEKYGDLMHSGIDSVMKTDIYSGMTDAQKAATVQAIYQYGRSAAKWDVFGVDQYKWITNAQSYAEQFGVSSDSVITQCLLAKGLIKDANVTKKAEKIEALVAGGFSEAQAKDLVKLLG